MKPSSDVFRPKLPSDPFVDLDLDQPWHIALNNRDPQLTSPRVILVFGAPSQADLRSLLTSQWLSDSLVLIATHTPPSWNGQPVPTVRILRLPSPLEEGGGRELASLFDRAERLAHQYRSKRLPFADKRFAQLAEKFPGGDFTVLEDYTAGHVAGASRHSSPTPATPKLKRISVISSTVKPKEGPSTAQSQQRTLDAIIHFIPASLSEKDIYKRAILVTTLSVSFLSAPLPHQHSPHADPPKRRFSPLLRSKHRQSLFLPYDSVATEKQAVYRPHLVLVLPKSSPTPTSSRSTSSSSGSSSRPPFLARHVSPGSTSKPSSSSVKLNPSSALYIPPLDSDPHPRSHRQISAPIHSRGLSHQRQGSFSSTASTSGRKRLAQSIEQFLIQFAYPAPSSPDDVRSVPYLISPDVFSRAVSMHGDGDLVPNNEIEALACEGRLSVGEAILLGLLDGPAKGDDTSNVSKSFSRLATRAWIADNQQVALVQASTGKARDDSLAPSLPPPPLSSVSAPPPTHRPNGKEKEWDSVVMRDESFFEGPTMRAILSPNPYPSFQNTPLPWSSFGTGSQPDEATVEKPAPIVPRMHVPLSPPLSTVNDAKCAIKNGDSDSAPIEATLTKHVVEPSATDTDATESVCSHLAKTASTDHSWPGAPGLLTPPESSSSSESCGASEYESCEMFSVTEHGAAPVKMVATERGPGPFVLFHSMSKTSADRRSKDGRDEAAKVPEGLSLTGRIGHQFRRLTKVMSLTGTAASSMSTMALSTATPKRRVTRRERSVLQAVVV